MSSQERAAYLIRFEECNLVDGGGAPLEALPAYVFDETTYTGFKTERRT